MLNLRIERDESPESPREWDNLGTMACWHRRYNLGDEQPEESPTDFVASLPKGTVVLPLYLYDHSGITMRTTAFSCPWDSGQVGLIYATPERIRKEYGCKRITKATIEKVNKRLVGEVETYDQFLTGDVWYYSVEDEEGKVLDSCGGFYGEQDTRQEGEAALKALQEKATV